MELKDVISWMFSQGYLALSNGKCNLTPKFNSEVKALLKSPSTKLTKPPATGDVALYGYPDWNTMYLSFIEKSEVPRFLFNFRQEPYAGNKFTETGLKAFQTALKEGIDPSALSIVVKLYYKSQTGAKKGIGSYLESGEWRTDYAKLVEEAGKGTLETYVKQEIKVQGGDNYDY